MTLMPCCWASVCVCVCVVPTGFPARSVCVCVCDRLGHQRPPRARHSVLAATVTPFGSDIRAMASHGRCPPSWGWLDPAPREEGHRTPPGAGQVRSTGLSPACHVSNTGRAGAWSERQRDGRSRGRRGRGMCSLAERWAVGHETTWGAACAPRDAPGRRTRAAGSGVYCGPPKGTLGYVTCA